MSIIRPRIFMSYSRKDTDYVRQVQADFLSSHVDCWMDQTGIQTENSLNPVIEEAISGASVFFAYVTKNYLESRWCKKEIQYALRRRESLLCRTRMINQHWQRYPPNSWMRCPSASSIMTQNIRAPFWS